MQSNVASQKRPRLYIEVKLSDSAVDDPFMRTDKIRQDVHKWLHDNYRQVKLGQVFHSRSFPSGNLVQDFKVTGHSRLRTEDTFHVLDEHDLAIAIYSLQQREEDEYGATSNGGGDFDDTAPQFTTMQLPHKSLDGMWESLVYAEPIPDSLLRVVTRMMRISKLPSLNPALICLHNLALLCGPPGSGKTTLAKALAQKLAIRLAHVYSAAKLISVNSPSLLSSFFGESSKLVAKMFDTIWNLSSDDSLLTVVVIDEVESMTSSRRQASQSNECGDAIRSTNEVLRGMDKLRTRSNVLFICTSNLKSSLDTAFIDRCGIKQDVGSPSTACAYEIFQTMINELIKNSLVLYDGADQHTHGPSSSSSSSSFVGINDFDTTMSNAPEIEGQSYIPSLSHTTLHLSHLPDCAPRKLYKLAQQAEGLSGRTLRRLPILALTKYTDDEPCTIQDLLTALKQVIAEEKASQNEDYELNTAVSSKNRETGDEFRKDSSENGDAEEAEDGTSELGSENWLFSMDSVRDGIRGIGIGQS